MSDTEEPKIPPLPATPKRPGRPGYSNEHKDAARRRYLAGDSPKEIAAEVGCSPATVKAWAIAKGWNQLLKERRRTADQIELEISRLSKKAGSGENPRKLAMLTRSLDRLRRQQPKPKPIPQVRSAVQKELLERVLAPDYGLYDYQREFLLSESRFRCTLKSRQIGFSYILALGALLGATAGRNQIVLSASEDQALIVMNHLLGHMERLEIVADEEPKISLVKLNGAEIRCLSTNYRTNQGYNGDLWLDEFAWVRNQKRLWNAVAPSITQVGGRITVCSTPFLPGSFHWQIAENHEGKWGQFERQRITIHDAIEQGMPLPGGIEELRSLYDSESWAMLYECQYAEDGTALLAWDLLHSLTVPNTSTIPVGRLRAGVDVGRTNHRTAIALLGQEMTQPQKDREQEYLERYVLHYHEMHKGLEFAKQIKILARVDEIFNIERWSIDRTGLGMQLAEDATKILGPERTAGIHFSQGKKERMALNLLKLCEDRKIALPNDPAVITGLHSVKKIAGSSSVRYEAESSSEGHGDLFWALAMAADGRARSPMGEGAEVEIL